jgi:hypothetical protein
MNWVAIYALVTTVTLIAFGARLLTLTRHEYELAYQRHRGHKVELVDLIESAVDASFVDPGQRPIAQAKVGAYLGGFKSESLPMVRKWQQGFPIEHVELVAELANVRVRPTNS